MSTVTFPTAEKVVYYRIGDAFYEKVLQSEAIYRPDAIRAVVGTDIRWFIPVGLALDIGKSQPESK